MRTCFHSATSRHRCSTPSGPATPGSSPRGRASSPGPAPSLGAAGGFNRRGSLSEAIIVKDNHLAGISIRDAIELARHRWPGRMVEVECDSIDQVKIALLAGATLVLCDNMAPDEVRATAELAR